MKALILTLLGAAERYDILNSPRKSFLSFPTTVLAQAIDTLSATAPTAPPCMLP